MTDSIDERLQRASLRDQDSDLVDQLVSAACTVVENHGADALTDPVPLAQAADCSPATVRETFPAHEDIVRAVVDDFYRRLDECIDPVAQETAAEQIAAADLDADEVAHFIETSWRILSEIGPASLIIRTAEESPDNVRPATPDSPFAAYDRRWLDAFERAGHTRLNAGILLAMMISQTKTFALHLHQGEISWREAARRHRRTLAELIAEFRPNR